MPRDALSRRDFLRLSGAGLGALLLGGLLEGCGGEAAPVAAEPTVIIRAAKRPPIVPSQSTAAAAAHAPAVTSSPYDALTALIQGNGRFAADAAEHLGRDGARRAELLAGQKPIAAVLTCADSRLPPELLFDQGLGDLFVVRTAGNLIGEAALGSLEYAIAHLGVTLIVVLGHQHCGAVSAAVGGEAAAGHIAQIVAALAPALEAGRALPGDPLLNAINANVVAGVTQLKSSAPILAPVVERNRVEVLGARYDLDTGLVEWLTDSVALQTYAAQRGVVVLRETAAPDETVFATPTPPAAPPGQAPTAAAPGDAQPAAPATPQAAGDADRDLLGIHVVRPGETLIAIGLAYGVSPWEIARRNHLANPDRISPGLRLRIPNVPWRAAPYGTPARRQF